MLWLLLYDGPVSFIAHLSIPPVELIMSEYQKHKMDNDAWFSPPFYSGPGGYKMCLCVSANGVGLGAGTHVSVYVHLMKGEYDDRLVWPFQGSVTIQLVNQIKDQDHQQIAVPFDDATSDELLRSRVTTGITGKGLGRSQFVSHCTLGLTTPMKHYLKSDCLKFRVTKVVVHSV